jgi:hypothetical protein
MFTLFSSADMLQGPADLWLSSYSRNLSTGGRRLLKFFYTLIILSPFCV